ncbi:hypothetical protein DYBT9275_01435 [Dyadobacter sp. CECT 9275]|uniref:Uncharacterized protein n=1 Tax=Dyadobacter helix TaxID=2822344 RepID=A0A916J9D6_9BACT|nr:hypothetical protein [Dyadobacter sp. CECT 9275]CAG4994637.1 hypothetical protein DYBT9275_01435 [Dyadobacter sp. CECT 9275]
MKKLIICCLIVFIGSCKSKKETEADPDYSSRFVGDYWTNTVNGTNSTAQDWKVTSLGKNLLGINYTINYTFREQGKEIKSVEIYKLTKVTVVDSLTFRINEDAELSDDGVTKVRKVEADGVRYTDAANKSNIGITLKFTDPGGASSMSDFLIFKKK